MSEQIPIQEQATEQHENGRIEDLEKAHSMAIASNRNESNIAELRKIASAHMMNPDSEYSPLKLVVTPIDNGLGREARYAQQMDPAKREIKAKPARNIAGRFRTAEYAINMAQSERTEADRVSQIAAVRHDALKSV